MSDTTNAAVLAALSPGNPITHDAPDGKPAALAARPQVVEVPPATARRLARQP